MCEIVLDAIEDEECGAVDESASSERTVKAMNFWQDKKISQANTDVSEIVLGGLVKDLK